MGFGRALTVIFDEKDINANELAKKINVTPSTIYSIIKRDNNKLSMDTIGAICRALDLNMDSFLRLAAEGEDSTDRVIGERLSSIREEKGISRKDIAAYLGISYEAYMFYENGDRKIKADTLAKICDYLDVSADELIGRKKATTGSKPVLCLTDLRLEKELNMRKVAAELGIPYTTYISYEQGTREPGLEMLGRLADYFGVTVDRLMGREKADDTMTDTRTHTDFESYDMWANAEKLYELDEKMKRLTERVERLEADGRNDGLTVNTASYWEKFLREE